MVKPAPRLSGTLRPAPSGLSRIQSFDRRYGYDLPLDSKGVPAWRGILEECGYPLQTLVLDFETFFDAKYGLKKMSAPEYLNDERFEILGLACGIGGDEYEEQTDFEIGDVSYRLRYYQEIYGQQLEGCTVVMQNSKFDCSILARRFGIYPRYTVDTLGLARHLNSRQKHGLDSLCKQWGLNDKGNTQEFAGASLREREGRDGPLPRTTNETLNRLGEYAINDALRTWELLTILLPRLSSPRIELALQHHTLELYTKPQLQVDYVKAEELKLAMEAEQKKALGVYPREQISGNISFTELLVSALSAAGDNPQKYFKPGKKGPLLAIAKTDNFGEELDNHKSPDVRALMAARRAIKSWPIHIKRIDGIATQARASGGFLPVDLRYYGAHTGRFSGAGGVNLQNLGSKSHCLINAIRGIIVAPQGNKLVIVDLGAIEARVLAWLAGQDDLLEKFRKNEDVYSAFASKILGYTVRKPRDSDPAAIKNRYTWARNMVGKISILGLGYGMGATKATTYSQGEIDLEMAEKMVLTYRQTHPKIVSFWRDIEKAFLHTAKYARPCQLPRGLKFESSPEANVIVTVPNGRRLFYTKVKITRGVYGDVLSIWNDKTHTDEHLWGGVLCENAVQAISRDILVGAMLDLECSGWHTVLHCHDELVLITPEHRAEDCLRRTIEVMTEEPKWAAGLPLAAEGKIRDNYSK